MESLPPWRRAGGPPACTGLLRATPDDFRVTEQLELDFDGAGEHDWLWLEKRETNTAWLARQLARFAGVPAQDVGYSGLKDRHAVTRQWFSVRRVTGAGYDWDAFSAPAVRILDRARHSRKLRRGAHAANHFEICLREVRGDPDAALRRIGRDGVPNYFGEQRFGRDGGNLELAQLLFAGRRLKREKRSIALSAARALIFNDVLDARIADGTWNCLVPGDTAVLAGTRSHFAVDEPDTTLVARCAAFDLHPSGPLHGREAKPANCPEVERLVIARHAALASGLERHCDAARRPLRAQAAELDWKLRGDALHLSFALPAGSFATSVLREVADYRDASLTEPSTPA